MDAALSHSNPVDPGAQTPKSNHWLDGPARGCSAKRGIILNGRSFVYKNFWEPQLSG